MSKYQQEVSSFHPQQQECQASHQTQALPDRTTLPQQPGETTEDYLNRVQFFAACCSLSEEETVAIAITGLIDPIKHYVQYSKPLIKSIQDIRLLAQSSQSMDSSNSVNMSKKEETQETRTASSQRLHHKKKWLKTSHHDQQQQQWSHPDMDSQPLNLTSSPRQIPQPNELNQHSNHSQHMTQHQYVYSKELPHVQRGPASVSGETPMLPHPSVQLQETVCQTHPSPHPQEQVYQEHHQSQSSSQTQQPLLYSQSQQLSPPAQNPLPSTQPSYLPYGGEEEITQNIRVIGMTGGTAKHVNVAGVVRGDMVQKIMTQSGDVVLNKTINTQQSKMEAAMLKARTKEEIENFTEGMVRVSAVDVVCGKLKSTEHWVTITGNAGDGKTTLGYLVLREFLLQGVSVYNIEKPEEFDIISESKDDKAIMFDDRFGAFLADQHLMKNWWDVIGKLANSIENNKSNTKVIFISRKSVVQEATPYLGRLASVVLECIVDLSTRKVLEERRLILDYHLQRENVSLDLAVKGRVVEMTIAHGFPHCCLMYSKFSSRGYDVNIEEFFESPLKFLDMTTRVLYSENCKELFQLLIKHDGKFNVYKIKDENQRQELLKVEKEQEGSYITVWRDGICRFAHPSIYESVLNTINKIDPIFCVQHATLSVIRQKMVISTCEEDDKHKDPCYILVQPFPDVLEALAKRIRRCLLRGDYSVFKHQLCESREFCEALVSCCLARDRRSVPP